LDNALQTFGKREKMKNLVVAGLFTTFIAGAATADIWAGSFDWEDGGTIVGSYGNLGYAENVLDPLGSGSNVLELFEDPIGGTPQAFLCWITGLTEGDIVTGSYWGLGDRYSGSYAANRIWGSYTNDPSDITSYDGSAGGNGTYTTDVWTLLEHTWTFNGDGGNHDGLVIQARMYGYSGDGAGTYTSWVDDLNVSVDDVDGSGGIVIHFAPIPAPGALALLGLAGIASRRRRQ
jgi:MYXO-CTERM domain-containing protein